MRLNGGSALNNKFLTMVVFPTFGGPSATHRNGCGMLSISRPLDQDSWNSLSGLGRAIISLGSLLACFFRRLAGIVTDYIGVMFVLFAKKYVAHSIPAPRTHIMSMPSKGDIIINPRTQRPVKIGGRTWLKLVKEGVLTGQYRDPSVLRETYTDEDDLDEMKNQLNSTLPSHKQAVIGRGKHKGKLVVRNKRIPQKDLASFTSKASAAALARNMDELENLDDDELERRLEELILKEMICGERPARASSAKRSASPRPNNLFNPKAKQRPSGGDGSDGMYVLEEPQTGAEWDDDEPSDYDPQVDGFDDDVYDTSLQW